MKVIVTLVFAALLSSAAFATPETCGGRLSDNFQNNSTQFSMDLDNLEVTAPVADKMGQAVQILRKLVADHGCTRADISFGRGPEGAGKSKCSMVIPERTNSLVCYVETNLGYFFVSWDMGHMANITFNLWD